MKLDSRKKRRRDRMMRSNSFNTQEVREIGRKEAGESRGFPIIGTLRFFFKLLKLNIFFKPTQSNLFNNLIINLILKIRLLNETINTVTYTTHFNLIGTLRFFDQIEMSRIRDCIDCFV